MIKIRSFIICFIQISKIIYHFIWLINFLNNLFFFLLLCLLAVTHSSILTERSLHLHPLTCMLCNVEGFLYREIFSIFWGNFLNTMPGIHFYIKCNGSRTWCFQSKKSCCCWFSHFHPQQSVGHKKKVSSLIEYIYFFWCLNTTFTIINFIYFWDEYLK